MTLEVPFGDFVETLKRFGGFNSAYLARHSRGTLVTAAKPSENFVIASVNLGTLEQTRSALESQGCNCHPGSWFDPESPAMATSHIDTYIAAVAYTTAEPQPGVWLDAFDALPTQVQVLRSLFDEFRETGDLGDVSFEEFVNKANPTVAIISPTEIQGFIEAKLNC